MPGQIVLYFKRRIKITWFSVAYCLTALVLAVMYFVIAVRHLRLPGLYYDEALFMPPAIKIFSDCNVRAGVYFQVGCFPIVLQPPYLGSLKALLYGLLFSILKPSVIAIRLPMIILHFASIAYLTTFWARRMGLMPSLLLFALLCTDTTAIFHARVDWGPYVIANFFKVACLCSTILWLETGRPVALVLLGASIVLGIFDKLNFLWVVGAVGLATLIVYGADLIGLLRRSMASCIIAIFSTALAVGVTTILLRGTLASSALSNSSFQLYAQAERIWHLLLLTLDSGAWGFFFKKPWPGPEVASMMFGLGLLGGVVFIILTPFLRKWLGRKHECAVRSAYTSWLTLIIIFLFLAMVVTKEATGSHHAVVISLLWQLQTVMVGAAIIALTRRFARRLVTLSYLPICLVGAALFANNVIAAIIFMRQLDTEVYSNTNFSPAIYDLVKMIDSVPQSDVVSVDWGTGNSLVALSTAGQRSRFFDIWPTFSSIGDGVETPRAPGAILGSEGSAIFIMHTAETAVFPKSLSGFAAATKPECANKPLNVSDRDGHAVYVVVIMLKSCLVGIK